MFRHAYAILRSIGINKIYSAKYSFTVAMSLIQNVPSQNSYKLHTSEHHSYTNAHLSIKSSIVCKCCKKKNKLMEIQWHKVLFG